MKSDRDKKNKKKRKNSSRKSLNKKEKKPMKGERKSNLRKKSGKISLPSLLRRSKSLMLCASTRWDKTESSLMINLKSL